MARPPLFVRPPTEAERQMLESSLRSADAFVLRRAQIILASARREQVGAIASRVGFSCQTVRNVIHAFTTNGVAALQRGSHRNHTIYSCFDNAGAQALRALLHRSPRDFAQPTSMWTLELVAEVASTQGLTAWRVSRETIRATLARLGVRWRRAKHWITSPDPASEQKALATLVSGVVLQWSAMVSQASAGTPGTIQDRSKQRRAQRLLATLWVACLAQRLLRRG